MEMGSKNALAVMDDGDLDIAGGAELRSVLLAGLVPTGIAAEGIDGAYGRSAGAVDAARRVGFEGRRAHPPADLARSDLTDSVPAALAALGIDFADCRQAGGVETLGIRRGGRPGHEEHKDERAEDSHQSALPRIRSAASSASCSLTRSSASATSASARAAASSFSATLRAATYCSTSRRLIPDMSLWPK